MKTSFRTTFLTCALMALISGTAGTVHAANANEELVRTAQMRLAGLGYYVGHYDGAMGPLTQNAIKDFQRTNGLSANGELTPETFSLLSHRDFLANRGGYYLSHNDYEDVDAYPGRTLISANQLNWDNRWDAVQNQEISTHYGNLDIREENHGSLRQYEVTFNGHTVLLANNQPGVLRVSQNFHLDNEDAVIFTAYNGDTTCAYQSYLLTLHSDGTFNTPRQIGNCNSNYEAHVADNALVISFPGIYVTHGLTTWDMWRYENNALARI